MQCYCLQFQPQDHSFLLQSDVFSNISKALSLGEDSQDSTEKKLLRDKVGKTLDARMNLEFFPICHFLHDRCFVLPR